MRSTASAVTVLALILGSGASLLAQPTGTVSGTLTNALSGDVVPGALIVLDDATTSRETRTTAEGTFSIAGVPAGSYRLSARADGFVLLRVDVTVAAGSWTTDLRISPELHYSDALSVSPEGRSPFESFQATTVLGGQELAKELQGSLGATIEGQPGIALRSFGPGPARPVVRGLDGDRVLILEDGLRMGDLSSQSGDHGVNANPAAATRIEVVRGPATLLYGANAIGGLVNVVTNDIPRTPVTGTTGSFMVDAASNAGQAGGAADLTVGLGRIALHLSGSGRRAGDYRSPGGEVGNSFDRAGFAEAGLAYTTDNGYVGGSVAYDRSHYGIPLVEDGATNLDPRRQVVNLRGERRKMGGFFDSVRGSFGLRRYRHDERDGDVVATAFENDTSQVELLAHHQPIGRLTGSIGGTVLTRAFATEGDEALSPAVDQKGFAVYVYEELEMAPRAQLQFGGRVEHARFRPAAGEPDRDFTNVSGSLGLLLRPTEATTVAFSLARAARNPALEELYFHGPHAGNHAFENGDPDLRSEQATGFDASFRWRGTAASGEVTYFFNRVDDFIFRQLSGAVVDDLQETFFVQGDATLQGIESHVDLRVAPAVWIEAGLDYVRGDLTATDTPLARMPPLRGRAGLRFQRNAFRAGADGVFTATQDRIYTTDTPDGPVGETPTEGYDLLKLYASYSLAAGWATSTITARLDNATNALYRNHLNYLKDLAPEMGRSFRLVYGLAF
jgi:iron complex outermembrane receptor protein